MCQHRRYAGPARPGLNRHRRTIMLAVLFPVTIVPALAFWMMAGVGAARLLRAIRAFNLTMAALLVASVVGLLREA